MIVRYYICQFHYRSAVDFNEDGLKLASKQFAKLEEVVKKLYNITQDDKEPTDTLGEIYSNSIEAMSDDFNTPVVMAEVIKFVKEANSAITNKNIEKAKEANFIVKNLLEDVLGLKFDKTIKEELGDIPNEIKTKAEARWQAKKNRDFAKADILRAELVKLGYEILDSKDGYQIKKI